MSGRAPECRFDDTWPDFCSLAQDTFYRDKGVDVIGPDITDTNLFGKIGEPDIDTSWLLPVLDPDQLAFLDRFPDIFEDLAGILQELVSKSDPRFAEPLDIPVIDSEGAFMGVFPGYFSNLFLIFAFQQPAPVFGLIGSLQVRGCIHNVDSPAFL